MFKRYNIKLTMVRLISISLICSILSGCFSFGLLYTTGRDPEYQKSNWGSDTIIALSLANDINGNTGWVFVGENFDYLLSSGVDNMVSMLKDPVIFRDRIIVEQQAQFVIDPKRKEFSGRMELNYHCTEEKDKMAIIKYGFSCNDNTKMCSILIQNLVGTIHKKNKEQDITYLMQFYHPFKVEFYQYKQNFFGPRSARVLLPVTLALDIVTSPLQYLYFTTKR
ncbi:hypothetical protein ABN236_15565 [Proteus sp. fly-1013]|uniref:YidX family protein n=1 Tax=Proteus sp. fly-1013 TaxID=3136673 RepID=UPI0032DA9617